MSDLREVELRFLVPRKLAETVDALIQVDGHQARADWVIPVLQAECDRRIHAATVLLRVCGINPLVVDRDPRGAE